MRRLVVSAFANRCCMFCRSADSWDFDRYAPTCPKTLGIASLIWAATLAKIRAQKNEEHKLGNGAAEKK